MALGELLLVMLLLLKVWPCLGESKRGGRKKEKEAVKKGERLELDQLLVESGVNGCAWSNC